LRLPSWGDALQIVCSGEPVAVSPAPEFADLPASGYDPRRSRFLPIRRLWSPGDVIELHFELPITLRHPRPGLKGHAGKVALTRGPLVYCLESTDNPGLDLFDVHIVPASLCLEYDAGLLGGVCLIQGETSARQAVTAIPYALWGNRGASQMTVWLGIALP
jgi:uncharacterized protein